MIRPFFAAIFMTTALVAAPAVAQDATTGPDRGALSWNSPDEKAMYEDNPGLAGFFTDETMQEMKSEDDMGAAYGALSDKDRDQIRAACERVETSRGSYGTVTQGMCARINAM